jgi:hypothetical protein
MMSGMTKGIRTTPTGSCNRMPWKVAMSGVIQCAMSGIWQGVIINRSAFMSEKVNE